MIKSYRVMNLRSIRDSGSVRMAKINILVGKNSAGKSTLLRVLPLLRQSTERPTKGPILWYGRFVDFGGFKNAINSSNVAEGISFEFQMSLGTMPEDARQEPTETLILDATEVASLSAPLEHVTVRMTIGQGPQDDTGKARHLSIDLGDDVIEVYISDTTVTSNVKVLINGSEIEAGENAKWVVRPGKIIPIPYLFREAKYEHDNEVRTYFTADSRPFSERLREEISQLLSDTYNPDFIAEIADRLRYGPSKEFYKQIYQLGGKSKDFIYMMESYPHSSKYMTKIRELSILSSISGIFNRIDKKISQFSSNVKYSEPLRATAQRYYRLQDLAVDEIDSRGENTAMFLNSLNSYERTRLQNWMKEHFGFEVFVDSGSGHVQVKIKPLGGSPKNIADLGFGYSQLLPIILQLWRAVWPYFAFDPHRQQSTVAIEQPELHLHPQFQAQIADVLAAASKQTDNVSIMVETHSEHIINRLGELISERKLSPDDVQILVVDQRGENPATVTPVTFDNEGYLDASWPSGFFVPEFKA